MLVASLLILLYGESPARVYALMLQGTFGSGYGLGQVLFKATPLLLCGLSVALAFRAGLFNIGAEGQVIAGAFACAMVGIHLPAGTPAPLAIAAAALTAFAAGALVGFVPGLLRAWTGAHEVINTLMLNFIVQAVLEHAGRRVFVLESLHTAPVVDAARLGRLGDLWPALRGSAANTALLLAVLVALLAWLLLFRTRAGLRLRALGLSPPAAECAGVRVGLTWIGAMTLAGGLAGLCGANAVLGYKGYYESGFSGGVGFMGIAVALLGRNHPAGVVGAALLFGFLSQGALAINALVPKELIEVLQAVIILALAAASGEVRRVLARALGRRARARTGGTDAPATETP
ncbi:MAG: ABC transporter permease [Deltaproteobacteria bacterium]|nr:ABC transporter permease [Deltaproteobacteria bacterium]